MARLAVLVAAARLTPEQARAQTKQHQVEGRLVTGSLVVMRMVLVVAEAVARVARVALLARPALVEQTQYPVHP
jgi:phage terminase Nu1 subunit (DNA packaging protein)